MNRINLICLGVRDIGQSLRFYKSIGFKTYEEGGNPPVVFFDNRGTKLELFPLEELAKDISADSPPMLRTGSCGIILAINLHSEREVDEFIQTVVRSGGAIAKQPQKVSWGGYSGYFQDPDGYYWEVAYADQWKFDENEMLVIEKQ